MDPARLRFITSARTMGIAVGGLFAVLLIRLYAIQIGPFGRSAEEALAQTQRHAEDAGKTLLEKVVRAPILDRTGRVLAESWYDHDLIIDPSEVVRGREGPAVYERALQVADILEAALRAVGYSGKMPAGGVREQMMDSLQGGPKGGPRQWLQVARGLSPTQRRQIREMLDRPGVREAGVRGYGFEDRLRRAYPYGAVTAQVVGYVGEDPRDGSGRVAGRAGVELELDQILDGEPGIYAAEKDAHGREFLPEWMTAREVTPGSAVVLTIDAEIQRICLEVLEATVQKTQADRASAVVLSARTGEVLAACTWPSADPANLGPGALAHLNLGAFIDLYEPGSTIKPVFVGWALQQKVITLGTVFDCGGPKGYEFFGQRKVTEYIANPNPMTTEFVVIKSSNVGATRIAWERLGLSRMYDALEAFRLAGKPPIPYPIPGSCRYTPRAKARGIWTGTSLPQGYEIMLSPLGLARIFLCYARLGEMAEPSLVREVRTAEGPVCPPPNGPDRQYRVLDREVAAAMLGVMERVVEEGTAKAARSAKWSIAGKTGTPKITGKNLYNPVFCGIAPVRDRDPEIVVVVQQHNVVGRGHGTYTGGAVSAPPARDIIERTLAYLGVPVEEGRPEKPPPR